jgi:hypothetical protein
MLGFTRLRSTSGANIDFHEGDKIDDALGARRRNPGIVVGFRDGEAIGQRAQAVALTGSSTHS